MAKKKSTKNNQSLANSARRHNKGKANRRDSFNKDVSKVSESKKQLLRKMVDSLIEENTSQAGTYLHRYLSSKSRELILGEKHDEDPESLDDLDPEGEAELDDLDGDEDDEYDDDEDDEYDDEDDEDDDDEYDDDEDDEYDDEGKMKKSQKKVSEATYKDIKHKNHAKHLSGDVEGRNYKKRGGDKMSKYHHGNEAKHLDRKTKGDSHKKQGGKSKLSKYQHSNKAPHLKGDISGEADLSDHKSGNRSNRT